MPDNTPLILQSITLAYLF